MAKDGQIVKTLVLVLLLFVVAELLLQLRAQLKFGNSIFTSALTSERSEEQLFVQQDGFKVLAADISFTGSSISVQSNAIGLRSAPIEQKSIEKTRVIVLGASSTYGAYAASNSETFPALLQLENPQLRLDVINAGIPGNDISSQFKLYEQLLDGLSEDVLILYSGLSNDISRLCKSRSSTQSYALPQFRGCSIFCVSLVTGRYERLNAPRSVSTAATASDSSSAPGVSNAQMPARYRHKVA